MDEKAALLEILRLTLASKSPDHVGDLIKIGLPLVGALLAAFVGYLTATRTAEINRVTATRTAEIARDAQLVVSASAREAEARSEQGQRRAAQFDALTTKIDGFSQALTVYATRVKNVIERRALGDTVPATHLDTVARAEKAFFDEFTSLLNAESRLLQLGHPDLQASLREFGKGAQNLYREVNLDKPGLTVDRVDELIVALRAERNALLSAIGAAERNWWDSAKRPA